MSTNTPPNPALPGSSPLGSSPLGSSPDGGAPERNMRKVMRGIVISNKMQKTVVVQVDRKVRHPLYEKFVSRRTKLYAHDENGEAKVGDVVELSQTRPISKLKSWRLVKIIQKASAN